jgi:VTC domain
MPHSREVRSNASEIKFVISSDLAARVQEWARANLAADLHGHGSFGDEYQTTSVYLDTAGADVFHRRGSFGRSKYRIRRYGSDETVFLERKLRQPAALAKRRTRVPLATVPLVWGGPTDQGWPGQWFAQRVAARQLQPVCQVSYHRTARQSTSDGELVRLTLDCDLSVHLARDASFAESVKMPVLSGQAILELKYRGVAPAIFRRLVEEFALTPQAASKYRLSLTALRTLETGAIAAASSGGAESIHA